MWLIGFGGHSSYFDFYVGDDCEAFCFVDVIHWGDDDWFVLDGVICLTLFVIIEMTHEAFFVGLQIDMIHYVEYGGG